MSVANDNADITFACLSVMDDICIDMLVDQIAVDFNVFKMNQRYRRKRIDREKIRELLTLIQDRRDLEGAAFEVFDMVQNLKLPELRHQDGGHMREVIKRYLAIYLTGSGFELKEADRYESPKPEIRVVAKRKFKVGETVYCLSGFLATLSPDEETEVANGKDFSVIYSKKKKSSCLFLGPARFVNHDCNPNMQLQSIGFNAVTFRVCREVEPGAELTTFYGENYFDEGNSFCQCLSCERNSEGAFYLAPVDSATAADKENAEPKMKLRSRIKV